MTAPLRGSGRGRGKYFKVPHIAIICDNFIWFPHAYARRDKWLSADFYDIDE